MRVSEGASYSIIFCSITFPAKLCSFLTPRPPHSHAHTLSLSLTFFSALPSTLFPAPCSNVTLTRGFKGYPLNLSSTMSSISLSLSPVLFIQRHHHPQDSKDFPSYLPLHPHLLRPTASSPTKFKEFLLYLFRTTGSFGVITHKVFPPISLSSVCSSISPRRHHSSC